MQRNKAIRNLFIVLVLLVMVLVGKDYLPKRPTEKDAFVESISGFGVQGVSLLTLSQGEESLSLIKDGGNWEVDKYAADVRQINNMLEAILEPVGVELVSETNQRHETLGVSDNAPILTIGTATDELLVYLGMTTTGGRYVRLEGQDRVYLVDGLTINMSSTNIADWVDKTIISVDEKAVSRITITQPLITTVLEQREGEWYEAESSVALDRTGFSAMLNTLKSFVTQGLFDTESEENSYTQRPEIGIVIERNGLDAVELAFYRGEDDALVSSSEREGRYIISSSLMDNFALSDDDLVEKAVDEVVE
jgi:hypothetical protein